MLLESEVGVSSGCHVDADEQKKTRQKGKRHKEREMLSRWMVVQVRHYVFDANGQ